MMPREYGTVDLKILKIVEKKWRGVPIKFEVVNCRSWLHEDRFGRREWIISLTIESKDTLALRKDLGLDRDQDYHPHITILECLKR